MLRELRASIVAFLLLTLITGAIYPLIVTGIARTIFARQSTGSIIQQNGKAVGSELIGQYFDDPKYFWPRPSATSDASNSNTAVPYNGTNGSGSNLATSNPAQVDAVKARVAALKAADPSNTDPVPVELVTASGSGLDPHITVPAARYQVARVARDTHYLLDCRADAHDCSGQERRKLTQDGIHAAAGDPQIVERFRIVAETRRGLMLRPVRQEAAQVCERHFFHLHGRFNGGGLEIRQRCGHQPHRPQAQGVLVVRGGFE